MITYECINNTIKELYAFVEHIKAYNYCIYSVTLTYADILRDESTGRYSRAKLPTQTVAINRDMKSFKAGIIRFFNRRGVIMECFFIYSRPLNERPHFHGLIATSEPKKVKAYVDKYWKKGIINKVLKIKTDEELYTWRNYIVKNIYNTRKFYCPKHQIKSRTRVRGN